MAPHTETETMSGDGIGTVPKLAAQSVRSKSPLQLSGALDNFDQFESTPCIGREYRNVDLAEWLKAPNSDALLRDLAITSKEPRISGFHERVTS